MDMCEESRIQSRHLDIMRICMMANDEQFTMFSCSKCSHVGSFNFQFLSKRNFVVYNNALLFYYHPSIQPFSNSHHLVKIHRHRKMFIFFSSLFRCIRSCRSLFPFRSFLITTQTDNSFSPVNHHA